MHSYSDKNQKNKSQSVTHSISQKQSSGKSTFQILDNRPEAVTHRELQVMANNGRQVSQLRVFQDMANHRQQTEQTVQLLAIADNHSAQKKQPILKKENKTGRPDNLKAGMESLSGMSLDDEKGHRKSDMPAQLQANAYAHRTEIHLGSAPEKHLPHQTWHVVQQKQGTEIPTIQKKGGVKVNDDTALEKEADVMGAKSRHWISLGEESITRQSPNDFASNNSQRSSIPINSSGILQRVRTGEDQEGKTIWMAEDDDKVFDNPSDAVLYEMKKGVVEEAKSPLAKDQRAEFPATKEGVAKAKAPQTKLIEVIVYDNCLCIPQIDNAFGELDVIEGIRCILVEQQINEEQLKKINKIQFQKVINRPQQVLREQSIWLMQMELLKLAGWDKDLADAVAQKVAETDYTFDEALEEINPEAYDDLDKEVEDKIADFINKTMSHLNVLLRTGTPLAKLARKIAQNILGKEVDETNSYEKDFEAKTLSFDLK